MAQPVVPEDLGSWRGEDVRLGEVLDALCDLRRGERRAATRTSVTNLVLVADDDEAAATACSAVHRLGRRHPGRSIVVVPRPDHGRSGIDAQVLLHGSLAGGHAVWSEEVRLEVRGLPARHLDSLVEPLTLAELPVAVWWVCRPPMAGDPLLSTASAVLVDSSPLDERGLASLAAVVRRHVVVDLGWARLRPLRQLLALQFESHRSRPILAGIRRVEAGGAPGARRLLAGWVSSRLPPAERSIELVDSPAPSLRLEAEHEGETAWFLVEQAIDGGQTMVQATTSLEGGGPPNDRIPLPDDPLASSLAQAIAGLGRDPVHGRALQAALGLAS